MPEKYVATVSRPRVVRVQNTDVAISECWYYPNNKDEMGRHWFDWCEKIQTATYRQPYGIQAASVAVESSNSDRRAPSGGALNKIEPQDVAFQAWSNWHILRFKSAGDSS